jgi:hypothetical protein
VNQKGVANRRAVVVRPNDDANSFEHGSQTGYFRRSSRSLGRLKTPRPEVPESAPRTNPDRARTKAGREPDRFLAWTNR